MDKASEYARLGYATEIEALDRLELAAFRREVDRIERLQGAEHCRNGISGLHMVNDLVWRRASPRAVLDAVQTVIARDILLLRTSFVCKYSCQTMPYYTASHQDVPSWGIAPLVGITAWIALDD